MNFISDLKTERDALILYVKRLDEEIAANQKKKTEASGDDKDVIEAEAQAAIDWYNQKKTEQVARRDEIATEYTERKTTFDVIIAQQTQRI